MINASLQRFTAIVLLGVATAQNNNTDSTDRCDDLESNSLDFRNGTFNASGSVSTPAYRVNDSYPDSTWTWSTYIDDVYSFESNTSEIWTTIGLQTSPIQNLTDPFLPYTGCIIALSGLSNSIYSRNHGLDNGTCNTVLSDSCSRKLLSTVRETAASLSNTPSGSDEDFSCTRLLNFPSLTSDGGECEGQWTSSLSSRFLNNNFSEPVNTLYPGCPLSNVGNSSAGTRNFFAWGGERTESRNYTLYDRALLTPVPIITAVWLKDKGGAGNANRGKWWSDARLMCVPTNITEPGSRNLSQAQMNSGSISVKGMSSRILYGVMISVLLGFVV